ncbi:hypothetical protein [Arthrobacter celericrescens]|uniref:hypothetical protein n=1 Tax=Arthrobacter celericrescens TaxID=2320851 RepID=UPI0013C4F268|nr:hypothetical protein [Arthrobacter celericrescens]
MLLRAKRSSFRTFGTDGQTIDSFRLIVAFGAGTSAAKPVRATTENVGEPVLRLSAWRTSPGSPVAAGVWLVLSGVVLVLGTLRIRVAEFATSRRSAHRVPVTVAGVPGRLLVISMGGAAVQVEAARSPTPGPSPSNCPAPTRFP